MTPVSSEKGGVRISGALQGAVVSAAVVGACGGGHPGGWLAGQPGGSIKPRLGAGIAAAGYQ